ncbi:MAG: hypothetical protein GEU73_12180 [Chloroflexi bacterium]|nr:hypothetical protein [Chloroflexota bacterium]
MLDELPNNLPISVPDLEPHRARRPFDGSLQLLLLLLGEGGGPPVCSKVRPVGPVRWSSAN